MAPKPDPVADGKLCAALAYLFPVGLVWYFAESRMRKNRFAAFHVHQGLGAAIVLIGASILGTLLKVVFVGYVLLVAAVAFALVWIVQGLGHALHGREEGLWLVGAFGRRFDF